MANSAELRASGLLTGSYIYSSSDENPYVSHDSYVIDYRQNGVPTPVFRGATDAKIMCVAD